MSNVTPPSDDRTFPQFSRDRVGTRHSVTYAMRLVPVAKVPANIFVSSARGVPFTDLVFIHWCQLVARSHEIEPIRLCGNVVNELSSICRFVGRRPNRRCRSSQGSRRDLRCIWS